MFSISFQCKSSIFVNKPLTEVRQFVGDFDNWQYWSPWICMEKTCPVTLQGVPCEAGHRQDWDGKRIGSGNMSLTEPSESAFKYDLAFIKPWKSKSCVDFLFEDEDGGTRVSWVMNGSLPIFMFFMKKMMTALVEGDFERGLLMMKNHLEVGVVHSDTEVTGIVEQNGFYYMGMRKSCSIADMPDTMSADFMTLMTWVQAGEVAEPKEFVSFYHKYDMVNKRCDFTSALVYAEKPENTKDLEHGQISNHKAVQVVHAGEYRYLGNAWSTVIAEQRNKKLKLNKSVPWYERYLNSPIDTAPEDLRTEINIAIK